MSCAVAPPPPPQTPQKEGLCPGPTTWGGVGTTWAQPNYSLLLDSLLFDDCGWLCSSVTVLQIAALSPSVRPCLEVGLLPHLQQHSRPKCVGCLVDGQTDLSQCTRRHFAVR